MMKKIIFIFLVSYSGVFSQEENPVKPEQIVNDEIKASISEDQSLPKEDPKKYSAQFIIDLANLANCY